MKEIIKIMVNENIVYVPVYHAGTLFSGNSPAATFRAGQGSFCAEKNAWAEGPGVQGWFLRQWWDNQKAAGDLLPHHFRLPVNGAEVCPIDIGLT